MAKYNTKLQEEELKLHVAEDWFASHFMSDYIAGRGGPITFSPAARAVLDAGRELWRYYHAQPNARANASYYDIRAHFQGRKPNGTMNATSGDETYAKLLDALKTAHRALAAQIAPKVYEYGFLRA